MTLWAVKPPDADPDHLAYTLMAAFQGGMLLTQAARDVKPLRVALDGALAYVASFQRRNQRPVRVDARAAEGRPPPLCGNASRGSVLIASESRT